MCCLRRKTSLLYWLVTPMSSCCSQRHSVRPWATPCQTLPSRPLLPPAPRIESKYLNCSLDHCLVTAKLTVNADCLSLRTPSVTAQPTFPIRHTPRDHRDPFSLMGQHGIPSDSAIKSFLGSSTGSIRIRKLTTAIVLHHHRRAGAHGLYFPSSSRTASTRWRSLSIAPRLRSTTQPSPGVIVRPTR